MKKNDKGLFSLTFELDLLSFQAKEKGEFPPPHLTPNQGLRP